MADIEYDAAQKARVAALALEKQELELRAAQLAHQKALGGLAPDLKGVTASGLETSGDLAAGSAMLTYRALRVAAEQVVKSLNLPREDQQILVTADPDLSAATGTLHDLVAGLKAIESAVEAALATRGEPKDKELFKSLGLPAAPLLAAVSTALPGVLSLASAQRTLTTAKVEASDLSAASEVLRAGLARGGHWRHDDFRPTQAGGLHARVAALSVARGHVAARKQALAGSEDADDVAQAALCEAAISSIDTFLAAVRTVPAGAKRSPLTTAVLADHLMSAEPSSWILLVKSCPGSSTMLTDNRPLLFDDVVFSRVEVGITFLMVDVDDGRRGAAGTVWGVATMRGRVGGDLDVEVRAGEEVDHGW